MTQTRKYQTQKPLAGNFLLLYEVIFIIKYEELIKPTNYYKSVMPLLKMTVC